MANSAPALFPHATYRPSGPPLPSARIIARTRQERTAHKAKQQSRNSRNEMREEGGGRVGWLSGSCIKPAGVDTWRKGNPASIQVETTDRLATVIFDSHGEGAMASRERGKRERQMSLEQTGGDCHSETQKKWFTPTHTHGLFSRSTARTESATRCQF